MMFIDENQGTAHAVGGQPEMEFLERAGRARLLGIGAGFAGHGSLLFSEQRTVVSIRSLTCEEQAFASARYLQCDRWVTCPEQLAGGDACSGVSVA
jgi:hypothetical protein